MKKCFWKGEELPLEMFLNKCRRHGLPHIRYDEVFDLIYLTSTIDYPLLWKPLIFGMGLVLSDDGKCFHVE